MALTALTWLYRKLGSHYPATFLTLELQSAFPIAAATVGLFALYFEGDKEEFLLVLGLALGLTFVAVWLTLFRSYPRMRPIRRWIDGERGPDSTAVAWEAAITLPVEMIRRDFLIPVFVVVLPLCVAIPPIIEISWLSFFPLLAGSMVAVGYAATLHYLVLEAGMRPVLIEINSHLPPQLQTECGSLPLRVRLMAALPLINLITGLVVAALTSDGGGGVDLGVDVLIALAVATTISLELTVLLSRSILRPISDLHEATHRIREGDYDISVPVTTGDELGELAASFNQMVAGLRERERIREAFGTYLDEEVAEYILSEGFSEEGVELEVSVLFCDVVDFTTFAAQADAREVVACLNELFEVIVPTVARHGGHIDKFEGDGLLAVFGAPENYPDHADRAVRAAIEIVDRVNGDGEVRFRVGVGVNTGRVVAGAIGGGGRLNFSVIGDAVNVAARVEEATRRTHDDVLIAEATLRSLTGEVELQPRGPVELKGIDGPVSIYAPLARAGALSGVSTPPRRVAEDGR